MPTPLAAYWWSPRRSLRTLRSEVRSHLRAWTVLGRAAGGALSNYGDELTENILRHVTGRRVRWAPLGREDVIAIGSILVPYFTQGGVGRIWGSGINEPVVAPEQARAVSERFLSVRGPSTRSALGLDPRLGLGDPGLLVRSMGFPRRPRSGHLLIPHFTVYNSAVGRQSIAALAARGMTIAAPNSSPDEMIRLISGADFVASSGLHGLILSQALGTPASLISFADAPPAEPGFKYLDYMDSVGRRTGIEPWSTLLGDYRGVVDDAAATTSAVSDRIDDLVEGLLVSAQGI